MSAVDVGTAPWFNQAINLFYYTYNFPTIEEGPFLQQVSNLANQILGEKNQSEVSVLALEAYTTVRHLSRQEILSKLVSTELFQKLARANSSHYTKEAVEEKILECSKLFCSYAFITRNKDAMNWLCHVTDKSSTCFFDDTHSKSHSN